jgi:hypothetical protein
MADPAIQVVPGAPVSVIADTAATPKVCKRVVISALTRVGTTATVKAYGHGLTNAVAYTLEGFDVAAYNGSKTITVVDADTFTFTAGLAGTEATPAVFNNAQVIDTGESYTAKGVRGIQLDSITGSTFKIEKRLHPNGAWLQEGADITTTVTTIVQYATPMPYVRVRRTAGAGDYKAFAQQGYGA